MPKNNPPLSIEQKLFVHITVGDTLAIEKLLATESVDLSYTNSKGFTASQLAEAHDHTDIVRLLEDAAKTKHKPKSRK